MRFKRSARVGYINAVSCTKAFKFTKVYDALLIHSTSYLGFKPDRFLKPGRFSLT